MSAEQRIKELGIELGEATRPVANYVPAVTTGNLVFISGQLPVNADGSRPTGKVGVELTLDEAVAAARRATIGLLSALRGEIGSLDRVRRVLRVGAYVNALPDFTQHPQVANGASDLLVEVFGEAGKHARAAVGVASLPLGAPVEIEALFEVE